MEHTWNEQGLAAHDEDHFHGSKLPHAETLALFDRVAELGDEDGTEEADADRDDDVGRALEPLERQRNGAAHDRHAVLDHVTKAESDRDQRNDDGDPQQSVAVMTTERRADEVHLKHQRGFHADENEQHEDDADDRVGIGAARHVREIAGEENVRFVPHRVEEDALADQPGHVEEQGEGIQREDRRLALLRSSQEQQDDQDDERGTKLAAVVDADADIVLNECVDARHGDVERRAIRHVEGDILRVRIEIGSHLGRRSSGMLDEERR